MKGTYPIAVFEDRYSGVYSGGSWIAVSECDKIEDGRSRFWIAFDGTHGGGDIEASSFGDLIPILPWIAVGSSPDEAIENLRKKIWLESR